MENMHVLCQEYMLLFCLPLSIQPRLNLLSTQQQGRVGGGGTYSMANRNIAYILGRGWAYILDQNNLLVPLQDGSKAGLAGFLSNIYARPLPRVYAIFLFAIEYSAKAQPPQHTTTGARAPGVAPPRARGPVVVC